MQAKNPRINWSPHRRTHWKAGGSQQDSGGDPMSQRGLAPVPCCPCIPEHQQSRDPTRLLQLHLHPRMGPHGMATPQRVTSLRVFAELWGPSPAARAACTMHAPPRSCLAPVLLFSPVAAPHSAELGAAWPEAAVGPAQCQWCQWGWDPSPGMAAGSGLAGITSKILGLLLVTHRAGCRALHRWQHRNWALPPQAGAPQELPTPQHPLPGAVRLGYPHNGV